MTQEPLQIKLHICSSLEQENLGLSGKVCSKCRYHQVLASCLHTKINTTYLSNCYYFYCYFIKYLYAPCMLNKGKWYSLFPNLVYYLPSVCRKTTPCYDSETYPINRKDFLLPCGLFKISALLSYCYTPTCQKGAGPLPVPEKSGQRVCQSSVAVATQAVPLPVSCENAFRQRWKVVLQPAPSPETTTHPSLRSSCKLQGKAPRWGITTSLSTGMRWSLRWCDATF